MKKWVITFKQRLEDCMLTIPTGKFAVGIWFLVALLLAGAYGIMLGMAHSQLTFDLFFGPIFVAVCFFKMRGLWSIIPAIILYFIGVQTVVGERALFQYLSSGFFEVLEWTVVSLTVIFAMRRLKQSRDFQKSIEHDMHMARKLQKALTPKNFDIGTVRIAGKIHQCKEVGGDYYYFRPFQNDKVVFCLGDVMGKGIPSSMVTSIIMGFVYEWGKRSTSPAEVLAKLNERLSGLWGKDDRFYYTTIFYAIYDETNKRLIYSNGGHHDAILLHPNGEYEYLRTEGAIVGALSCEFASAFGGLEWNEKEVELQPGDRVVVFTDGVNEARDAEGKMFTTERAVKVLRKAKKQDNTAMIDALFNTLTEFTGGTFSDDVAVLIMEVKPE